MENPRPEKVAIVSEVRERLQNCDAALITEYRGMTMTSSAQPSQSSCGRSGSEFKVYKNTLVRFAARDAGIEGADDTAHRSNRDRVRERRRCRCGESTA